MDSGDVGITTGSVDEPVENQNGSDNQTLEINKIDNEPNTNINEEMADTADKEKSVAVVEDSSDISVECLDVANPDEKSPADLQDGEGRKESTAEGGGENPVDFIPVVQDAQVEDILEDELGGIPAAQDKAEEVGKEKDLENADAEANLNEPAENIDTTPTEAAEESQLNLSLPNNVQMVQAKTEDGGTKTVPKYEKGMKLLYKNSVGIESCTILDVHLDDMLEPYYTIRLEDGREKQTDNAHIILKPQDEEKGGGDGDVDGDKTKEHLDREIQFVATQTNESTAAQQLDREILFDTSIPNMKAFHQQWITASDKALSFTAPVLRVSPGRFFWSPDLYEKRILAIYKNPDYILVMRLPKDNDEVCRLGASSGKKLNTFLIVESVANAMACKIRLSQLTNATSVPTKDLAAQTNGLRSSMNGMVAKQNDINRKRSCFDLLTPSENVTLSAAFLPADCFDDLEYTNEKSLNDTHRCEDAIISALVNAHISGITSIHDTDQTWKHQVILGTLHSYVISGNDEMLKESLASALEIQQSQCGGTSQKLDPSIIDLKDDSGRTVLHYACNRRKNSTVNILVNAGADCSMPQDDEMTPCHICAKGLDEKILSIVLSASYPTRPNPNALDAQGQTPMYLAAVEGKGADGQSNAVALDRCLSALDAWSGQLMVNSPKSNHLLHPVHCVSVQWKAEELSVILSHCNYRYPLTSIDGSDAGGISLSATFQYPIHAALISLRNRVHSAFEETSDEYFNAEYMPLEPPLLKTLKILLEHGFEPNERVEGIYGKGDAAKRLSCFFGFTPLQVLALVVVEAGALESKKQDAGEITAETIRILRNIMKVIQACAEVLLKNGARINVPPPPSTRLDRPTPTGCYSLKEAIDDPNTSSISMSSRDGLTLDGKNNQIINLLGGVDRVNAAQKAFVAKAKSVNKSSTLKIESTSNDSDAPGGSDSNSCAICWSEFGVISNRKHLCRVTRRYVCNDCSTKRLVVNGSEQRVSDGQYLLSISEAGKTATKQQAKQKEQMQKHRQSVTQARESLGLNSKGDSETNKSEPSTQDRISSALSGLGQMKDKVLERGDKLESLQDKSEALEKASLDFANMAKELNRSQNSWFG